MARRDVRGVEGARLESVCRGNPPTVGSNPTLSATTSRWRRSRSTVHSPRVPTQRKMLGLRGGHPRVRGTVPGRPGRLTRGSRVHHRVSGVCSSLSRQLTVLGGWGIVSVHGPLAALASLRPLRCGITASRFLRASSRLLGGSAISESAFRMPVTEESASSMRSSGRVRGEIWAALPVVARVGRARVRSIPLVSSAIIPSCCSPRRPSSCARTGWRKAETGQRQGKQLDGIPGAPSALGPLELATTHYRLCNTCIGLAATTFRAGK